MSRFADGSDLAFANGLVFWVFQRIGLWLQKTPESVVVGGCSEGGLDIYSV